MGKKLVTFNSAVRATVTIATRPASVTGARDVSTVVSTFVSAEGEALRATMSTTEASNTLRSLIEHINMLVPDLGRTKGRPKPSPTVDSPPTAEPTIELVEIEGLTRVSIAYRGRDRKGRPVWKVFTAPQPIDGEIPLLYVIPGLAGDARASLLMDVWAAAEYRDQLHSTLSSLLPTAGPRVADVPIVATVDLA